MFEWIDLGIEGNLYGFCLFYCGLYDVTMCSKNIFDKLARRARTQILTDDTQIIGSPNYGSLK